MTVCIAAQANYQGNACFVLCADSRIGDDYCSGDVAFKMTTSNGKWAYLMAGTVARSQEFMAILHSHMYKDQDTESDALQAFRGVPKLFKTRLVEEYLNTRWGITEEQFREFGAAHFPPDIYTRIHLEIEQIGTSCEVIVSGFAGLAPVMFFAGQTGEVTPRTGFMTAGTGGVSAQAALFQRDYKPSFPIQRALYCVYEAKRFAERAVGVGPTTTMAIWGPLEKVGDGLSNAQINFISPSGLAELGRQFESYGPQNLGSMPEFDEKKMLAWPHLWK